MVNKTDKELELIKGMKGPFKILAYIIKFRRLKEVLLFLLGIAILIIILQNIRFKVKTDTFEFEYDKAADIEISK